MAVGFSQRVKMNKLAFSQIDALQVNELNYSNPALVCDERKVIDKLTNYLNYLFRFLP
jgi:hypothetical protein